MLHSIVYMKLKNVMQQYIMHMESQWTGCVWRNQAGCLMLLGVWEETGGNSGLGTLSADSSTLRQHSQTATTPVTDWEFSGGFLLQFNIF